MLEPKVIELLEEVFAIGGNHDTAKIILMRKKLVDFMTDNNLFLKERDENFVIIKDAIRFIDAHTILATTTSQHEASTCLNPFFKRLYMMRQEKWNYYELKFLISSLQLVEDIKRALSLGLKSLTIVSKFNNAHTLKSSIICNVCYRILYAQYFGDHDSIGNINLALEFNNWFRELERMPKKDNDIELDFLVTKVRKALFFQNRELINELLNELKTNYGENLFDVINEEVITYYTQFAKGVNDHVHL